MNPTRMTALLCAVLVGLSATAAHAVDQYWQDIRTQTKAGPLTVAIEWEGVAEFGGGMVYQHIQADASGPIRGTTGWRVRSMLGGKVPVVVVSHDNKSGDILGTITHNRARGVHLLEPMQKIVKELLAEGKTVKELEKELGMKPEEVYRLSGFSRDDFLNMLAGSGKFNKAYKIKYV